MTKLSTLPIDSSEHDYPNRLPGKEWRGRRGFAGFTDEGAAEDRRSSGRLAWCKRSSQNRKGCCGDRVIDAVQIGEERMQLLKGVHQIDRVCDAVKTEEMQVVWNRSALDGVKLIVEDSEACYCGGGSVECGC